MSRRLTASRLTLIAGVSHCEYLWEEAFQIATWTFKGATRRIFLSHNMPLDIDSQAGKQVCGERTH